MIRLAAIFLGVVVLFQMFAGGGGGVVKAGDTAPAFTGTTLEGKPFTLEGLRGKVVVLDFWATWCPPCRQAIPHILAMSQKYAGKGVVVLGINQDSAGSEKQVREFVAEQKLTFPQVMDNEGKIFRSYGFRGIPSTVVIDSAGIVRDVVVGYAPGVEKKIEAKVEELLKL